jgi:hypothetical protein
MDYMGDKLEEVIGRTHWWWYLLMMNIGCYQQRGTSGMYLQETMLTCTIKLFEV